MRWLVLITIILLLSACIPQVQVYAPLQDYSRYKNIFVLEPIYSIEGKEFLSPQGLDMAIFIANRLSLLHDAKFHPRKIKDLKTLIELGESARSLLPDAVVIPEVYITTRVVPGFSYSMPLYYNVPRTATGNILGPDYFGTFIFNYYESIPMGSFAMHFPPQVKVNYLVKLIAVDLYTRQTIWGLTVSLDNQDPNPARLNDIIAGLIDYGVKKQLKK